MNQKQALLATLIMALGSASPASASIGQSFSEVKGSCWIVLNMLWTRCKDCGRKPHVEVYIPELDADELLSSPETETGEPLAEESIASEPAEKLATTPINTKTDTSLAHPESNNTTNSSINNLD